MKRDVIIILVVSVVVFLANLYFLVLRVPPERKERNSRIVLENLPLALGTVLGEEGVQYLDSEWRWVRSYYKNDCRTSLWQHRETGEIREVIGMEPPMKKLEISKGDEK